MMIPTSTARTAEEHIKITIVLNGLELPKNRSTKIIINF